jgi:hypothetical protein
MSYKTTSINTNNDNMVPNNHSHQNNVPMYHQNHVSTYNVNQNNVPLNHQNHVPLNHQNQVSANNVNLNNNKIKQDAQYLLSTNKSIIPCNNNSQNINNLNNISNTSFYPYYNNSNYIFPYPQYNNIPHYSYVNPIKQEEFNRIKIFNAQRYALNLYDKNYFNDKDYKRNYQIMSTNISHYFDLSPVEIVFLDYYFWYCNHEKKRIPYIEHYTSNYLRDYIKKRIVKILNTFGNKELFLKWKKHIKDDFDIDFGLNWDSFRIDYKKFIIYPKLRNYAAKGLIAWKHVREWVRIEPLIGKDDVIENKTYFDNIYKNLPNSLQKLNKSNFPENTSKLIEQIDEQKKLSQIDNSEIFKIFSNIYKLKYCKEKMIQLTKSEDGKPSSSINNIVFESFRKFSHQEHINQAEDFQIVDQVFEDWRSINDLPFIKKNFSRINKKLYFDKQLHNIASRGLINDYRTLDSWKHIKKKLPDDINNYDDKYIKKLIEMSMEINEEITIFDLSYNKYGFKNYNQNISKSTTKENNENNEIKNHDKVILMSIKKSYNELANLKKEENNMKEALKYYEEELNVKHHLLNINKEINSGYSNYKQVDNEILDMIINIADIYHYNNNYLKASTYYEYAIEILCILKNLDVNTISKENCNDKNMKNIFDNINKLRRKNSEKLFEEDEEICI